MDTVLKQTNVMVQWNSKIYDKTGICPKQLRETLDHLDKLSRKRSSKRAANKGTGNTKNAPVVLYVSPDQLTKSVRQNDWVRILKAFTSGGECPTGSVLQPLKRKGQSASALGIEDYIEVDYMSSEKSSDKVSFQPVQFRSVYTTGQVVQLQMSAKPERGMLKPQVEILHTALNASVCTQHISEPVLTLTRPATRATRGEQFSTYKEYVRAWTPLLEMEAAVGCGDSDGSIVIDNVPVILKTQNIYKGYFTLSARFCRERSIKFGGKLADSLCKEESKSEYAFPLDYLCLRYKSNCSGDVVSRIRESLVPQSVDKYFTWLAHASVVDVIHKDHKKTDGGTLLVTFVLTPSSRPPPSELMTKDRTMLTVEILPKPEVHRRAQQMLLELRNPELKLAQAMAFGGNLPELGSGKTNTGIKLVYLFCKVNRQLENKDEGMGKKTVFYCGPSNKSVDLVARELKYKLGSECPKIVRVYGSAIEAKDYFVPRNDLRSSWGMRDLQCDPDLQDIALHHLIREHGKPYAEDIAIFEQFFKLYQQEPDRYDMIIDELKEYCNHLIRYHGKHYAEDDIAEHEHCFKRHHQELDGYSVIIKKLKECITCLIPQQGKAYAENIAEFEHHLERCHQEPDQYSMITDLQKEYRKLLFKASIEEIKHYEVILATCAVGGNRVIVEGAGDTIFQCIIDECAMNPEPHSLVPIVANKAKQVVLIGDHKQLRPIILYQPAGEMGLNQSLFERLFLKFPSNTTFLNTQYRMHPEICAFPSKEFYDGNLVTSNTMRLDLLPFWPRYPPFSGPQVPHLLVNVQGEEETLTVTTDQGNKQSKSNRLEAEKVIEILTYLKKEHKVDLDKIRLLTQYNAQRHLLEKMTSKAFGKHKVNVSTVVASQGGEWDYVILSTVRSLPSYKIEHDPTWCRQNLGFITDCNQINVAITRARRGLFIIGNMELLRCDDVWQRLISRYDRMGCCRNTSFFPPVRESRRRQRPRPVQRNATYDWQTK